MVVGILLAAAVAVRLAWHPLGPWVALAIAFAAGLASMAVYRMQGPPRVSPTTAEVSSTQSQLLRQD
jgi:cytochrome b